MVSWRSAKNTKKKDNTKNNRDNIIRNNMKSNNMKNSMKRNANNGKVHSKISGKSSNKFEVKDVNLSIPLNITKSKLKSVFEELLSIGFNDITYSHGIIDINGNSDFNYTIKIDKNSIIFKAKIKEKSQELKLVLLLIRLASVISDYGTIAINPILGRVDALLTDMSSFLNTSYLSLSAKYKDLYNRNNLLEKKYDDLVVSSEQNARLLLECDRKRGEVESELRAINKLTDKQLMVEVFKWIKIHNGKINFDSFSDTYGVPQSKIEDAINLLIKEGYIEKE